MEAALKPEQVCSDDYAVDWQLVGTGAAVRHGIEDREVRGRARARLNLRDPVPNGREVARSSGNEEAA